MFQADDACLPSVAGLSSSKMPPHLISPVCVYFESMFKPKQPVALSKHICLIALHAESPWRVSKLTVLHQK